MINIYNTTWYIYIYIYKKKLLEIFRISYQFHYNSERVIYKAQ